MFTIAYETPISNNKAKVVNKQAGNEIGIIHGKDADIYLLDGREVCSSQELVHISIYKLHSVDEIISLQKYGTHSYSVVDDPTFKDQNN